jgi:DNA-directed RNA polymerase specialized sigma24 family protein
VATLLERVREGDKAAPGELADAYAEPALLCACAMLEQPGAAETAASEGILAAIREADRFESADDEARFVLSRVRREALLALREGGRRRRRRRDRDGDELEAALTRTMRDLPAPDAVVAAFAELRPPLSEALSSAFINGLDVPELSRRLSTSEAAARARLRAALVDLMEALAGDEPEAPF